MYHLFIVLLQPLLGKSDGMWRSPVAQRSGGPEVASSNLVIPTSTEKKGWRDPSLFRKCARWQIALEK